MLAPLSSLPASAFREIAPGFVDREGNSFIDLTLTADWRSNNLLQPGIFATGGSQRSLSVEFALPGSQLSFYKLRLFGETYTPLNRFLPFLSPSWIIHLEGTLGYGDGYGGTEQLPFFSGISMLEGKARFVVLEETPWVLEVPMLYYIASSKQS